MCGKFDFRQTIAFFSSPPLPSPVYAIGPREPAMKETWKISIDLGIEHTWTYRERHFLQWFDRAHSKVKKLINGRRSRAAKFSLQVFPVKTHQKCWAWNAISWVPVSNCPEPTSGCVVDWWHRLAKRPLKPVRMFQSFLSGSVCAGLRLSSMERVTFRSNVRPWKLYKQENIDQNLLTSLEMTLFLAPDVEDRHTPTSVQPPAPLCVSCTHSASLSVRPLAKFRAKQNHKTFNSVANRGRNWFHPKRTHTSYGKPSCRPFGRPSIANSSCATSHLSTWSCSSGKLRAFWAPLCRPTDRFSHIWVSVRCCRWRQAGWPSFLSSFLVCWGFENPEWRKEVIEPIKTHQGPTIERQLKWIKKFEFKTDFDIKQLRVNWLWIKLRSTLFEKLFGFAFQQKITQNVHRTIVKVKGQRSDVIYNAIKKKQTWWQILIRQGERINEIIK